MLVSDFQDYLVSGAAGYVSFCQGAPDNVLDGDLMQKQRELVK